MQPLGETGSSQGVARHGRRIVFIFRRPAVCVATRTRIASHRLNQHCDAALRCRKYIPSDTVFCREKSKQTWSTKQQQQQQISISKNADSSTTHIVFRIPSTANDSDAAERSLVINKNNYSTNTESRTLLLLRQPYNIKKTDKKMLQIHAGLEY